MIAKEGLPVRGTQTQIQSTATLWETVTVAGYTSLRQYREKGVLKKCEVETTRVSISRTQVGEDQRNGRLLQAGVCNFS